MYIMLGTGIGRGADTLVERRVADVGADRGAVPTASSIFDLWREEGTNRQYKTSRALRERAVGAGTRVMVAG